jgi:hypothetical protein
MAGNKPGPRSTRIEGPNTAPGTLANESDAATIAAMTPAQARAALYLLTRSERPTARQVATAAGVRGGTRTGRKLRAWWEAPDNPLGRVQGRPLDAANLAPQEASRDGLAASRAAGPGRPGSGVGPAPIHGRARSRAGQGLPIANECMQKQLEVLTAFGVNDGQHVRDALMSWADVPPADLRRHLQASSDRIRSPGGFVAILKDGPPNTGNTAPPELLAELRKIKSNLVNPTLAYDGKTVIDKRDLRLVMRRDELAHERDDLDSDERWRVAYADVYGAPRPLEVP